MTTQAVSLQMLEEASMEDVLVLDIPMQSSLPGSSPTSQMTVNPSPPRSDPPAKSEAQIARVLPRVFCTICRRGHPLRRCHKFQRMAVEERLRMIIKHGCCGRCLSHDHTSGTCRSVSFCSICRKSDHNTLLHFGEGASPSRIRTSSLTNRQSGLLSTSALQSLMPSIATRGQRFRIRALLDSCSASSRLSLAGLRDLGLVNVTISADQVVDMVVSSVYRPELRLTIAARLTNYIDLYTPTVQVAASVADDLFHLKLADEKCHEIMKLRIIKLSGLPNAQDSQFGWILSGPCKV